MNRLLILVFSLPLFACGQSTKFPTKADLTKIYSQAIEDFIKVANKKNAIAFDTIYIAKRKIGQPDDFPDIELPEKIENTQVRLINQPTNGTFAFAPTAQAETPGKIKCAIFSHPTLNNDVLYLNSQVYPDFIAIKHNFSINQAILNS